MVKKLFFVVGVFALGVCYAEAKTANEVQPIDASQRNQISASGGGAGDVTTTGNNTLSGNNTFSGDNTFSGENTYSSTNTFNGWTILSSKVIGNTNIDIVGGVRNWQLYPLPATDHNVFGVYTHSNTKVASVEVGSPAGNAVGSFGTDGSGNLQISGSGTGYTDMYFQSAGSTMLRMSATTITLGANSGSAITMTAGSMTAANGFNINSIFNIPSSGTITNSSSLTSLNTLQASNVVATTTDGIARWSSGTNQTGILDVNLGAGTLQTKALFTASTNTPAGINPASNIINTNGSQRLFVNISIAYSANSGTFLWTSTAQGPKNRFFTPTAGITNFVSGWVQPNALWTISNYVGTATCIPGEGHLETH